MTKKEKRETLCPGCTENFYNGNNNLGVKECWNLDSSKIVRRIFIGIDWMPPYAKSEPVRTLSCHRKHRMVSIDPKNNSMWWKGEDPPKW
jgi:hypothetical protein